MKAVCVLTWMLLSVHPIQLATVTQNGDLLRHIVHDYLEKARLEGGFPGATAAALLPDGSLISTAVGFSDLELRRPMLARDRMLAGSVGKTLVSAVLLQLVDEHQVRLDDPLKMWLGKKPWFRRIPNAEDITIRMLLNHTSGIPDHVELQPFANAIKKNPKRVWSPDELLAFVMDKPALFPAGKGWSYADTNYILVGMVIELVAKDSLYHQIQKRFLEPLGLTNTSPSDHPRLRGLVPSYADLTLSYGQPRKMAAKGKYDFNPQFEWAGGGFISDSADLARWVAALYAGCLVSRKSFAELVDGVATPRGYDYGLGVYIRQTSLGTAYGHGGQIPGYYTITSYWPEKNLAIAIQFNTDDPNLFQARTPSYIFLPKLIDGLATLLVEKELPKNYTGDEICPVLMAVPGTHKALSPDK